MKALVLLAVVALSTFAAGCGSSPTTPSTGGGLAGQWNGTTSQGSQLAFTVSADEKVTSITIGYSFNGCSGSRTYSNLNIETAPNVTCAPAPCTTVIPSIRGFSYTSRESDDSFTIINGVFGSSTSAQGTVGFTNYPGCATQLGVRWSATKR